MVEYLMKLLQYKKANTLGKICQFELHKVFAKDIGTINLRFIH